MRHFELTSVSAGFQNCGLDYAASGPAIKVQKSALICRTENETNRWTGKQQFITRSYGSFVGLFIKVLLHIFYGTTVFSLLLKLL